MKQHCWEVVAGIVLFLFLNSFFVACALGMKTDLCDPEIKKGDSVLSLRIASFFRSSLKPGRVVEFEADGKIFARKVVSVGSETFSVFPGLYDSGSGMNVNIGSFSGVIFFRHWPISRLGLIGGKQ